MSNLPLSKAFAICALTLTFCISAFAQGTTSRITGTVYDAAGAPVSGATVTIKRDGAGAGLTTQTSDDGRYTFDLIQAGTYEVTVEKAGFSKYVSTGNVALVNQPATINVSLVVGDVSATVTVVGAAEQVQTSTSGNFGGTVEQRTVEALPIVGTRGRNPLDILNFQPGVANGSNTGGGVHVNGSRDRAFNFTLDGIDINESTAGGSNFTPLRPNPDSIQEFQIVTSGFTAELGRSSGAQVTFVTRSGGNDFHGNLFEYYQTKGWMARSYASNVNGTAKENFIQHIFGGSFSGPLYNPGFGEGKDHGWMKDKAFFFLNLQMLRESDALLQTRTVYTPTARTGVFRWVYGGTNGTSSVNAQGAPTIANCPVNWPNEPAAGSQPCIMSYNIVTNTGIGLDPFLMNYINGMPEPNSYTAGGDGLNTAAFQFNSPQSERQYDFTTKIDFIANEKNSFYFRWANGEQNTLGDSVNGGRPRYPGLPNFIDTYRTPKNWAFNWRWSPTSKIVNEFIAGWSRFGFWFGTPEPDLNYAFVFNLPTDSSTNNSYNARSFRTWQFVDNLTFDFSPHVIKAGANIRLGRSVDDRTNVGGGAIEFAYNFSRTVNNNFALPGWVTLPSGNIPGVSPNTPRINTNDRTRMENMINDVLGRVGTISQAFVSDPNNPGAFAPAGTRWIFEANHPEIDFYLQDTWRVLPNLTLDIGARWEIKNPPSSAGGRPILVPNKPFVLGSAPANDIRWVEGELFDSDYGLIMPSIGIAWDPFKDGKTSIRANFREASDRFATFLFSSFIFQNTPGNTTLGSNTSFGANGGLLRNGLPSVAPTSSPSTLSQPVSFSTSTNTAIDPDLKFPRIYNWSFGFQREIWGGNVIEVNYIGKKGTHLFGGYNVNQVDINAAFSGVAGVSGTFLDAFKDLRNASSPTRLNNPFINYMMTGNAANQAGTTQFRSLYETALTQGSVASAALSVSQQTCTTALITATVCGAGTSGQRLLNVRSNGFFFQPYSQFTGGLFVIDSNDISFYNGLEFTFRRRMHKGLSYQIGYTWAVSKDSRSFDPALTAVASGQNSQTGANYPFDNYNRMLNYSYSDFDRRHSLLGTYVYELPFGKGKTFASDSSGIVNHIIGGWQLAGTIRITSGRPFSVLSSLFTYTQTTTSTASCDNCPRDMGEVIQADYDAPGTGLRNWWFSAEERSRFIQPGPGEQGNLPRNWFVGPSYFETDISVLKKFNITERVSFDMRVDARNLLNHPNLAAPTATLPAGLAQSGFGTSIFGRINADTTNNARRIQISGKLNF